MSTFHFPEYRSTETPAPDTRLLSTVLQNGRRVDGPPTILSPVKPEKVIYELMLFMASDGGLGISNKLNANVVELFKVLGGLSYCIAEIEDELSERGIDLEKYRADLLNQYKTLEV